MNIFRRLFKKLFPPKCAMCGDKLHKNKMWLYGGIEDKATEKTHYVCTYCFDWFHNRRKIDKEDMVIRNGKILIEGKL